MEEDPYLSRPAKGFEEYGKGKGGFELSVGPQRAERHISESGKAKRGLSAKNRVGET